MRPFVQAPIRVPILVFGLILTYGTASPLLTPELPVLLPALRNRTKKHIFRFALALCSTALFFLVPILLRQIEFVWVVCSVVKNIGAHGVTRPTWRKQFG